MFGHNGMTRSLVHATLCNLGPEFGNLESYPRDLSGAVITAAIDALPTDTKNLYASVEQWLATVTPEDRSRGWLERYALTLPFHTRGQNR